MDASLATPAAKQEIRLTDYEPPAFEIKHTSLTFKLFADYAEVTAISQFVRRNPVVPDLLLDGGPHMELVEVALDGLVLTTDQIQLSADSLKLRNVPDSFALRIVTKLVPQDNTRLEGLYHSGGNFCTQCEAEGFRHITYFLDRPDVLTCYDVRIEAEKGTCPLLLSNGNPGEAGDLENGRHFAEWHDPHPKPSYLFALVAGDLACNSGSFKTKSGKDVELNVYVEPKDLSKSKHALNSLKRSMTWDEDRFGLEYDLDVYNIVAVSDFNMGAMENKGLNVFNTKYVLASSETATDADFGHVEGVIGHEYFHNWTGNRVTCRDWFQLSLKEGLTVFRDQEFSADLGSRVIKRLDDVRSLRMLQFSEDAGPLAHPVRPEKYIEINNFYTATVYNKGAEVIRMMHLLIGEAAFRRGMDLYFERYDGQAVTCEDFVRAMEDASGQVLGQFRLWYSQAGTPRLEVRRRRTGKAIHLTIEQSCPATPGQSEKRPNHMPILVGWLDAVGRQIEPICGEGGEWRETGCLLDLKKAVQTFVFENVPEGAVPSLLRQFSAPVRMEDDLTAAELAFLMRHDQDGFARWEAAQKLASKVILSEINGKKDTAAAEEYRSAFTSVLADHKEDTALIAELLTLPGEIDLGQKMARLDAAKIHRVRGEMMAALARENSDAINARYQELNTGADYSLNQKAKADRRLCNILLAYIAKFDSRLGEQVVRAHYEKANNMTDRMAALSLIAHSDFECRKEILHAFHEDWKDDALVVDKWFAVQANSARSDVIEQVKQLTNHPAFSLRNPNRLRSLVSTFAMLNQAGFHTEGGDGYTFLSEMIVAVDVINPQTAARLVAPLGRWSRMPDLAGRQMKEALDWILSHEGLSDDVRELCIKSAS